VPVVNVHVVPKSTACPSRLEPLKISTVLPASAVPDNASTSSFVRPPGGTSPVTRGASSAMRAITGAAGGAVSIVTV
jgi:hypothetical protein